MARIKTISAQEASGIRRALVWQARRQYGYLPGIIKILLPDLALAWRASGIYNRLQLSKRARRSAACSARCSPPSSTATSQARPDWPCTRRPCAV